MKLYKEISSLNSKELLIERGDEKKMQLKSLGKNKRGQIGGLATSILSLVFAAVVLVFGIVISQELRDTQTAGSDAYVTANKTLVGLGTFADFWEIIVLAIVIAVVIGLLLTVFGGGRRQAGIFGVGSRTFTGSAACD